MRYPTRNGLIISPYELGYTQPTPEQQQARGRVNIHHGYYFRHSYDARLRGVFRNLITNTYPLIISEHSELHTRFNEQPRVPKEDLMIDVVEEYLSLNGVIHCIHEKKTKDIYEVSAEQWERIRASY